MKIADVIRIDLRWKHLAASFLVCWQMFSFASAAFAGGGPENVVVLVNSESQSSKRIANAYVELRNIPDNNVIYLDDVPDSETTDVETFRNTILKPAIDEINSRKIAARIDYIVYSSDFPTAIRVNADTASLKRKLPKVITPTASINGLTFLAGLTLAKNPSYLGLDVNAYAAQAPQRVLDRCCGGESVAKFNSAKERYKAKDVPQALTMLKELSAENSRQPALHYWIARCQARLSMEDDAINSLRAAVATGWCFRAFTESDSPLLKLKGNKNFIEILDAMPDTNLALNQSRGFQTINSWAPNGMRVPIGKHGTRYMLSTVLAVTRGAGTTEEEAIASLTRAVNADATRPKGAFYFTLTGDVRTKTRKPGFDSTVEELERLGHLGEIVSGVLPRDKFDVAGAMIGSAGYKWKDSGSTILPGAICENLTSFGGKMDQVGGQTKLSNLLLAGAAGSSGTVTEPYALQAKFPHPSIHVHYVRGCSLAESFYQSVTGPYQLLIVGDPLCQPWAVRPKFEIVGLRSGETVSGAVECATLTENEKANIARYDVFMDGRFAGVLEPGKTFRFDSNQLADGFHELRVVAIARSQVLTQARQIIPFYVNNHSQSIELKRVGDEQLSMSENLKLRIKTNIKTKNESPVHIIHAGRKLATLETGETEATIACQKLGSETVRLQATATVDGKPMYSEPITVNISAMEFEK